MPGGTPGGGHPDAMAVASNWDAPVARTPAAFGLERYFDHVLSSMAVGVDKPHAGIFLEAARRLAVTDSDVMHRDNPCDDYLGAKRAGLQLLVLDRSGQAPSAAFTASLAERRGRLGL